MALLGRVLSSFQANIPVATLNDLDGEFNQLVGAAGALNGGGSGKRIYTKYTHATEPVYQVDQLGAGKIALFQQNGVDKVTINNDGTLTLANTAVCPGLNADRVDSIEGANIAKIDTQVSAFSVGWFYALPPGAVESIESVPVFITPIGTSITITNLRAIFRTGTHTGGTVLTWTIKRLNASGGGLADVGTITIDNTAPALQNIRNNDIGDVTLANGDYIFPLLTTRTGSPTEQLITINAVGTQKLT